MYTVEVNLHRLTAKEETIVFIAVLVFTFLVPPSTKCLLDITVQRLSALHNIYYCHLLENALDPIHGNRKCQRTRRKQKMV